MVSKPKVDAASPAGTKVPGEAHPEPAPVLPHPVANVVLANLALRGGGALLKLAVEKGLLSPKIANAGALGKIAQGRAEKRLKTGSLGKKLVTAALTRVASRSVPGAIVVGGGLLAKTLYDRRKAKMKTSRNDRDQD